MTELTVDEVPLQSLPDRYGVARSQVFNRIKALGIETIKRKNKAYVNQDQLAMLDDLHKLIQQGKTLEEAAAIINPGTRQSRETAGQYLIHTPSPTLEQSHGTPGQLEMIQMLMAALAESRQGTIAHQQPPSAPPNPLSRFEQLQAISDHAWRPSTKELADILGLSSLPGPSFERYGFRFTRAGKNGAQTAWKVEKCHV